MRYCYCHPSLPLLPIQLVVKVVSPQVRAHRRRQTARPCFSLCPMAPHSTDTAAVPTTYTYVACSLLFGTVLSKSEATICCFRAFEYRHWVRMAGSALRRLMAEYKQMSQVGLSSREAASLLDQLI